MGTAGGCFHYMRYVMAFLGCAAFVLLFLIQDAEAISIWRYHNHYNVSPHRTEFMTFAVSFTITVIIGIFHERLSAKWTMIVVMWIHAIHALLCIPLYYHRLYLPLAILTGVASITSPNICFIAMHAIISKWSPPNERSLLISIVHSGIVIGGACFLGLALSANETSGPVGVFIIIWIILWYFLIDDSPEHQKRFVSQNEKNYIRTSIENYGPRPSVYERMPLKRIIFSNAFISVIFVESSNIFIQSLLTHSLMASLMRNSFIHPGEYIGKIVVVLMSGIITAICLQRKIISFDLARKIPAIIAIIVPLPFIAVIFAQKWQSLHDVFNIINQNIIGLEYTGVLPNIIDISPNNAPVLMTIVLIIDKVCMAAAQEMIQFVDINFKRYEGIMIITPMTVFAVVSAILYCFWGSTAPKTMVSTVRDPTPGKNSPYKPTQTQHSLPV